MRMLAGFEDAAVVNARVSASKMGFFRNLDGDSDDILEMDAEPGKFEDIGNREFIPYTPQFPDQAFDPFCKAMLRSISSGLGVSYNNLASDLTSVNFSSIRQGALDEREVWKGLQEWLISGFVMPIYEAWLERSLLANKILIAGKPHKFDRLEKYKQVAFTGRRWAWIDPSAEMAANEKAISQKLKSRSEIIRETSNRDPEDVWSEIEREEIEMKKRNIVPLVPAGAAAPVAQPEPQP
jgi:lambda family phage portal protein